MDEVLWDELRAISDKWLATRGAVEKGFSLGRWDRDYLVSSPIVVARRQGRVVAFANLMPAYGGGELSVGLMRQADEAPTGTMDLLFVTLIEFKLTTLAGFVLLPFALWNKTAFLAEKVLGNVVSSGIKVLVLAVIVGIGSGLFAEFRIPHGSEPSIDHSVVVMLASLTLLALGIFGPGIATGLVSGGPQLGAGAMAGAALGPDSFTHGSSAQRVRWFKRGLETGNVGQCNTFQADRL